MSNFAPLDPISLTRQLVDIESTTYCEGAVGDFLAAFLEQRGWDVEKMPVPQPSDGCDGPRWNVYGGPAGTNPELVFSTHMDTVPPYIPFREDDDFLYGRGVCDAKGIIAAQIAAAETLRASGYKVGVLFVSGEERDSAGAKVANEHSRGSRFLINGEPTDNRLALASKGSLRAILRSTGTMAHSAYPELGESAIHKLVQVLERLLNLELPVTEDVGPSTLNIGLIHGGHAPNVIADKAEAQVLTRLVSDSTPIREMIRQAAEGLAEVDFTLEIPFQRLKAVAGLPTMIAKFTTDIPWLDNWGEPLLLGPGSIHVAHTPFEKIAKKELLEAVDLYVKVATELLSQAAQERIPCSQWQWTGEKPMASIYDIPLHTLAGQQASLEQFKGKVVLVVNVASKCGLTPQYEGLEKLYRQYRDHGFVIAGFPSNDFAGQEPGSSEEIQSFCTMNFGVDFPMFEKILLVGSAKHPLYRELIAAQPKAISTSEVPFAEDLKKYGIQPNPEPEILWNFEKFLLNRSGEVIARFAPNTAPDDPRLIEALEAELSK